MQFKLANVVLKVEKHAKDFPELYYRVLSGDVSYSDDFHSLHINGNVDFLTYVNGLSAGKWHQYASVDSVGFIWQRPGCRSWSEILRTESRRA